MSQEKLSELAILSIKKEMLEKLKYKSLISNFTSQKTKKKNKKKILNKKIQYTYYFINI